MKVFYFLLDRFYDNIVEKRLGEWFIKLEMCGENMEKCFFLVNKNNIIGMWDFLCFKISYILIKSKNKRRIYIWNKFFFYIINSMNGINKIGIKKMKKN